MHSCSSLRVARCIAFDQPVWHRGDALFCWAHAPRECTVFSMDTISYHTRKLAPTIIVNKTTLAFSFWLIFISATMCTLCIYVLLAEVNKNHHRSSCNNPFRLGHGLRGKGQWLWRKLTCICHLHYSHRISTQGVTSLNLQIFLSNVLRHRWENHNRPTRQDAEWLDGI